MRIALICVSSKWLLEREESMFERVDGQLRWLTDFVAMMLSFLFSIIEKNAAMVMVLCTAAAVIIIGYLVKVALEKAVFIGSYLWYSLKQEVTELYHIVRRKLRFRTSALLTKHRWSRRVKGVIMAKWERSLIADILHDALFVANVNGIITDKQYSRWSKIVGIGLGLPDMLPRKLHRAFIRAYFLGTDKTSPKYAKLSGPKKVIPGGPPKPIKTGDSVGPPVVVPHSKFLNKMKEKQAA